jgi:nitrogen fixation-related uncharacterized protein
MTVETFSATALLILFITFAAVALAGIVAVLVWAARTKQFSNQDAARYLPLKSGIPGPTPPHQHQAAEARHVAP